MQRIRDIGSRRTWRDVDAVKTEFLTADEVVNLTIRAGTLTLKERDVINYHIDPDLFDVFIKQGVYRDYAEQFLDPAQIDAVDDRALAG